jgi:phosphoglycolate phosphatase
VENSLTPPLVVFDLDGTLLDTAPDLVASLNYTIAEKSLPPVVYADLTHLVGQGARVMIEKALRMHDIVLGDAELTGLFERFIGHYRGNMPGESRPYPGLIEALDRLAGAGHRLAVCTNKIESLALPLIDSLGLTSRFAAITGGDTFAVRKPDAEHLLGTVRLAGGDPARTVMIGDSISDIAVAANANIPSIAVPFGYSDVPVESLSPTIVIDHFDRLTPELIEQLIA